MTSRMTMNRRITIQKTTKLLLYSILQHNLSKFITHMDLYYSKQLERTFHQFCEKPLHIIFKSHTHSPTSSTWLLPSWVSAVGLL